MNLTVTTKSGTVYTIDTEARTWKRERNPEACAPGFVSNEFDPSEGTYAQLHFAVGESLTLVTQPDPEQFDSHFYVKSTPVVSVMGAA